MTIHWSSLPEHIRLALQSAGIDAGNLVYFRKRSDFSDASFTCYWTELLNEGLRGPAAQAQMSKHFQISTRTVRRRLNRLGLERGAE